LNGCVKLALTVQLIEHNQLSAEDVNEAEAIDRNTASIKTYFIVAIPYTKTLYRWFNEIKLL
jgi:hypothetical protein